MAQKPDAGKQVQALLQQGWVWRDAFSDVLVHPADHTLAVKYDRAGNVLRMSPALVEAVALVIPSPPGKKRHR
jgi:hypothetical protein